MCINCLPMPEVTPDYYGKEQPFRNQVKERADEKLWKKIRAWEQRGRLFHDVLRAINNH